MAAGKVVPVQRDFSGLSLKPDHAQRPLWISPEGQIILEATSEFYHQAYDFLIAIGEPVSRPTFIHEYGITPYSLFAAASVGLTTEDIIDGLNKFSKTELHPKLVHYIKEQTERCGKVKLLLDQGKFYIESKFPVSNLAFSHCWSIMSSFYPFLPRWVFRKY